MTELEFLLQLQSVLDQMKHLIDQRVKYLRLSFAEKVEFNSKNLPPVVEDTVPESFWDGATFDPTEDEVETGFAF